RGVELCFSSIPVFYAGHRARRTNSAPNIYPTASTAIVTTERATSDSELAEMGIRRAIQSGVARIMEIRHSVRENRLSNPNLVTADDCAEFIERSEMWVWEEDGIVQAFAAG